MMMTIKRRLCRVCRQGVNPFEENRDDGACTNCRSRAVVHAKASLVITYSGRVIGANEVREAAWGACGAVFQHDAIEVALGELAAQHEAANAARGGGA